MVGAVLEVEHLAQPGDVVGQRGHRELGCGDVVAAACRRSMTALQLEPSAHAPWTRTMFGRVFIPVVPSWVRLKVTLVMSLLSVGLGVGG